MSAMLLDAITVANLLTVLTVNSALPMDPHLKRASCGNGGMPHPDKPSICVCPQGFGGNLCEEQDRPSACGEIVQASWKKESLTRKVSTSTTSGFDPSECCYWFIRAPSDKRVEAKLALVRRSENSEPCTNGAVEVMLSDLDVTGARICSEAQRTALGVLRSTGNTLVIKQCAANDRAVEFTVDYKIGKLWTRPSWTLP